MTTQTQPKTRTIPAPFYAAAGAADLAYQKLRTGTARDLDVEKLREVARRNAAAVVAGAQAAQEKAVALYTDLVARGEKVVKGGARNAESTAGEIAATADADARTTRRARTTSASK